MLSFFLLVFPRFIRGPYQSKMFILVVFSLRFILTPKGGVYHNNHQNWHNHPDENYKRLFCLITGLYNIIKYNNKHSKNTGGYL